MKPTSRNAAAELEALDAKVNDLLPPRYQHCYGSVSPNSMGSATLSYGPDGKVAWDQIWTTFCDLAMAGGPPHRGTFLEPAAEAEVLAAPERYSKVVAEIDRALGLTVAAVVAEGYAPGWVGVRCTSPAEAAWLQFAVLAENVAARRRNADLQLPAGPTFRAEKEIKNVVVALSKSLHYWDGHLSDAQQRLFRESVWEPVTTTEAAANAIECDAAWAEIEAGVREAGATPWPRRYAGWVGVEGLDDEEAVWLLRALMVEQVPARREENVLYLPVDPTPGAGRSARVVEVFTRAWELRQATANRRTAWRPFGRSS